MGELTAFDDEPAMSRKMKDGAGQKKLPTTKRAEEKPKRNGWVRQIKLLIEFFFKT
jgi:hypothetical protein